MDAWMHECNAAIILLTEDALKSDWVQAESTFVAVRDRNEGDFKLIPVLLNGVTADKVTKHPRLGSGSAAHLDETQFVRHQADDDAIINTIKSALNGVCPKQTPFDELGRVISRFLQQADQESLEAAWEQLPGEDKPTLQTGPEK